MKKPPMIRLDIKIQVGNRKEAAKASFHSFNQLQSYLSSIGVGLGPKLPTNIRVYSDDMLARLLPESGPCPHGSYPAYLCAECARESLPAEELEEINRKVGKIPLRDKRGRRWTLTRHCPQETT